MKAKSLSPSPSSDSAEEESSDESSRRAFFRSELREDQLERVRLADLEKERELEQILEWTHDAAQLAKEQQVKFDQLRSDWGCGEFRYAQAAVKAGRLLRESVSVSVGAGIEKYKKKKRAEAARPGG